MNFIPCLMLISLLATSLAFRLVIRVCFKDTSTTAQNECAFCNPRTLQRTMKNCTDSQDGIPSTLWSDVEKRCILRTCRQEHPSQKILPTVFPLEATRMESK